MQGGARITMMVIFAGVLADVCGVRTRVFGDVPDHFRHRPDAFQSKFVHAPDRPLPVVEMASRGARQSNDNRHAGCINGGEKNNNF